MNRGWFAQVSEVRHSRVVFWSDPRALSIVVVDQAGRLGSDGHKLRLSERRSQSLKVKLSDVRHLTACVGAAA
jgi:hypothetical protein